MSCKLISKKPVRQCAGITIPLHPFAGTPRCGEEIFDVVFANWRGTINEIFALAAIFDTDHEFTETEPLMCIYTAMRNVHSPRMCPANFLSKKPVINALQSLFLYIRLQALRAAEKKSLTWYPEIGAIR